ncbi:MAG: DUF4340 domain-containing protein [Bdellovibrionota bacterium]
MKSLVFPLTLLLGIQIFFGLILTSSHDEMAAFQAEDPLLDLSLEDIDEVLITVREEGQSERVLTLRKESDIWILPDYYAFPVSGKKLSVLQEKLFQIKKPYPVGSTELAAKQFEVSDKTFQTRVELKKEGDIIETLYLGTSPSFKKIHLRRKDELQTYAIPFSSYELRAKENAWLNREYLHLQPSDIKSITFHDFTLERDESSSMLLPQGMDASSEQAARSTIDDFVKNITTLSFLDVLGEEVKDEYNLTKPAHTLRVALNDGTEVRYDFGDVKDETHYVLRLSGEERLLKIAGYQVDKIKDVTRADLIEAKEPVSSTAETSTENQTGEN